MIESTTLKNLNTNLRKSIDVGFKDTDRVFVARTPSKKVRGVAVVRHRNGDHRDLNVVFTKTTTPEIRAELMGAIKSELDYLHRAFSVSN